MILEMVKVVGLVIGNVFIVELQDVMFVVLVVYVILCKCYGLSVISEKCLGNVLEKGGRGLIIEQLFNVCVDVMFGGGVKIFVEMVIVGEWQGKMLCEQVQVCGYQLVSDVVLLNVVMEVNQ